MLGFWALAIATYFANVCTAEIATEEVVELRWDFTDCGHSGRFGPSEEQCDAAYKDTNLEGDVELMYGVQVWTVPVSGLYLVTARGPSGAASSRRQGGKGAELTAEFHMTEGQRMKILVGQQSDFSDIENRDRPVGGSGGTFIVRESDGYVLMVAGGGSSGAGTKWDDWSIAADASLTTEGKNSSTVIGTLGVGGVNQSGGSRGVLSDERGSAAGGGAGFAEDGAVSYVRPGGSTIARSPRAPKSFMSVGVTQNAPGVGGYFMYINSNGRPMENNGGFGGGGAACEDGGSGGAGGYSGGGGGLLNGWGGGGGSVNNGGRRRNAVTNRGRGSVSISFIGHQCCGPVVVYIAVTFIAGVIFTILVGFLIVRTAKAINEYDGSVGRMWVKFTNRFKSNKGPEEEKKEEREIEER